MDGGYVRSNNFRLGKLIGKVTIHRLAKTDRNRIESYRRT